MYLWSYPQVRLATARRTAYESGASEVDILLIRDVYSSMLGSWT